ncbi:uncharacterized protein EV420DRAFT_1517660 [Desarmillaria tabescens]|uniref:LysM domain-containing protein n=1 Tax=Armillaria tabescens TaxID=1929756 RepID=A0AA39NFI3_ARMTA|nr:uncharacterized protein EV420DRAFT_1517660 [Desarmillaria tabescens]KAK0464691.1 hypothetical protein EV420DRAFT_1517660 [Desarmillaria tabescens]
MFSRAFISIVFIAVAAMSASVKAECDDGTPGYTHIVVSGDTCFDIATEGGISVSRLEAANPGIECDNLQIGDRLCVPRNSAAPSNSTTPNNSTAPSHSAHHNSSHV